MKKIVKKNKKSKNEKKLNSKLIMYLLEKEGLSQKFRKNKKIKKLKI